MTTALHEQINIGRNGISRRGFIHTASVAAAGFLSLRDTVTLQAEQLRTQNAMDDATGFGQDHMRSKFTNSPW